MGIDRTMHPTWNFPRVGFRQTNMTCSKLLSVDINRTTARCIKAFGYVAPQQCRSYFSLTTPKAVPSAELEFEFHRTMIDVDRQTKAEFLIEMNCRRRTRINLQRQVDKSDGA